MTAYTLLEELSAGGRQWMPILLDLAVKGAAILSLTSVAALAMRRASAAARHLVWLLGMCSLLILPILCVALPGWHVLPRWDTPVSTVAAPPVPTPALPTLASTPPTTPFVVSPPSELSASPTPSPRPHPVAPSLAQLSWQAWALLIWSAGALLLMAHIALGFVSLRWLERRSYRIAEGEWLALLLDLRTQLGIRRPVELLGHAQRTMPMTWGLWRTRLLLPEEAFGWTMDQRRAVLLHELAHVRRWDCLSQLAAQMACALYWMNPLTWLAWHRIQSERERACDDLVLLRSGAKASAYAQQLLQIASELPPVRLGAAAIAMARPGSLEGRLLAILDSTRNRKALAISTVLVAIVIVGVCAAFVAVLRSEQIPKDPATRWAREHGWTAQAVTETTLESRWGGWRDLPFTLTKEEEADARACMKLLLGTGAIINGKTEFSEPSTRAVLEEILARRPGYFYAEFVLATWYRDHGDVKEAARLLDLAYQHAPVIVVQRYELADGTPLANTPIQSFALECNRIQQGYLDPSLQLEYRNLRTDAQGCIYLPVYNTVYRCNDMAFPDGYSVDFPRLGWFEASRKVAVLPTAKVTAKPGDFAPAAPAGGVPTTRAILPGNNSVELLAVSAYPNPQNTWWLPDGSPSPRQYQPGEPGGSPWPAEGGRRLVFRFAKALPEDAHIQFRFSVPSTSQVHFTTVRSQDVKSPYNLFTVFPTHPKQVTLRMGLASGPWKEMARFDPKTQKTTGNLPPGFAFKDDKQDKAAQIKVVHPSSDLELRVFAVDANDREHAAGLTGFERNEQVFGEYYRFETLPIADIKSYRLECREYQWVEFQNIAMIPAQGNAPAIHAGGESVGEAPVVAPKLPLNEPSQSGLRDLSGTWTGERDGVKAKVIFDRPDSAVWYLETPQTRAWNRLLKPVDVGTGGVVELHLDYFTPAGKEQSVVMGTLRKDNAGTMLLTVLPAATTINPDYVPVANLALKRADLSLDAHVLGLDGKPGDAGEITFWRAVSPLIDPSKLPDPPKVWKDPAAGRAWETCRNVSGAGGSATATDLDVGDYRVTAMLGRKEGSPVGVSEVIHLDGTRKQTEVTVQLERGPALDIDVVDAHSNAVLDGAEIVLTRPDGLPVVSWASGRWAVLANGGKQRFACVAPGVYTLSVSKPAWYFGDSDYVLKDGPMKIVVGQEDQAVTVRLEPRQLTPAEVDQRWPWMVTGKVTDEGGRPMQGVAVYAACGEGTLPVTGHASSGADGRYTLRFRGGIKSMGLNGRWHEGLQAAIVTAQKEGYSEKNLGRQGKLAMADEMPANPVEWAKAVVVPGRPVEVDFVMVPSKEERSPATHNADAATKRAWETLGSINADMIGGTATFAGTLHVTGTGQDAQGEAFVTCLCKAQDALAAQYDVVAVGKDGRQLNWSGFSVKSPAGDVVMLQFNYRARLTELETFLIRSRPVSRGAATQPLPANREAITQLIQRIYSEK